MGQAAGPTYSAAPWPASVEVHDDVLLNLLALLHWLAAIPACAAVWQGTRLAMAIFVSRCVVSLLVDLSALSACSSSKPAYDTVTCICSLSCLCSGVVSPTDNVAYTYEILLKCSFFEV